MNARSRTIGKSHGVAGIVGGVLFFAMLMSAQLPGGNTTPSQVIDYFGTRSHQLSAVMTAYGLALAAFLLAWFFIGLYRRTREAEPDGPTTSTTLASIAGIATVGSLLFASASIVAMGGPLVFESGAKADAGTVAIGWLAISLLVIAMLPAAVTIFAVSVGALRSGALPRWNVWLGLVSAVLLVPGSIVLSPMVLLTVWSVSTSITLLRPVGVATVRATRPVAA